MYTVYNFFLFFQIYVHCFVFVCLICIFFILILPVLLYYLCVTYIEINLHIRVYSHILMFKEWFNTLFQGTESCDLIVSNLPDEKDASVIKRRLKQLSENCGGRVIDVQSNTAVVRFPTQSSADRYIFY